ncbi:MAG: hypothetical protein CMM61_09550 [Rhodospirillaceae bacterium]|nr:hypothetical protein [Rhodospirillaceae bacterium]|tara:strand:- start:6670 stop:8022 length:1353 start_codon:yes stop_codon:yes gene_type:complete
MTSTGNAHAIAAFIESMASRPLPSGVLNAARMCLADWTAVTVGAHDQAAGRLARDMTRHWNANGLAPVFQAGTAAPVVSALVNGTFAHCLDFDDTHVGSLSHLSGPTWAAVLALASERQRPEERVLRAFIAGFEVGARIGGRLFGETVNRRGFHATSVFGKFAATAAACALLDLRGPAIAHAMGIAATQGAGLVASFGTMGKPLHAGKAAMDGVMAAQLAAEGFLANPDLLEPAGEGFADVLLQDRSLGIAKLDFDDGWEILNNTFKPYAACLMTHPAIEAAREIGTRLAPVRITKVQARVNPMALRFASKTELIEPLDGKFSIAFCIALGLHGRDVSQADFNAQSIRDTALRQLMTRIELIADPAVGATSATLNAIDEAGNDVSSHIPLASGNPGRPMTWAQMENKFMSLARPVLGDKAAATFAIFETFGDDTGLPALTAALTEGARSA